MKSHRSLILSLALGGLAALRLPADPPANPAWGKAADNHIFAQKLVYDILSGHPDLVVVGLHAVAPGAKNETLIACNLDRIGKQDDDDDIAVATDRQSILSPNLTDPTRFEVQLPLLDLHRRVIGSTGFVFHYHEGDDQIDLLRRATSIRDSIAYALPDKAALFAAADFTPPNAADNPLAPGATVEIPGKPGKFDFLHVDPVHHRLLCAHEKAGSADFIDLDQDRLITRVFCGPAVGIVLDPATNKYFVSGSDDKTVYVLNADSLKQIDAIAMPGELDAILLDPKNHRIFVTNDEGSHVWAIDPETDQVVATIDIPGVPEDMVYDAGTNRIYLNLKTRDEIAVIDPDANAVVTTWSTAPAELPHGLGFDPDTGRLFSAGINGRLAVIDIHTGSVVAAPTFAALVDQAAFDPSTKRIYCACTGQLSILQETDDGARFVANVVTDDTAKNVAVDPATHAVWTTYTDGSTSYAKSWTP